MSVTTLSNIVNGELAAPLSKSYLDVICPSTGEVVAKCPNSNAADVNIAVEGAAAVFDTWSTQYTAKQRAAIMFRFQSLVERNAAELADIICVENGKNVTEALADVAKGNETVEWASSMPQLMNGRILEVSRGITCREQRVPLGVVAAIVPFNFPVMVPMWTIPIALTAGNCVICKPSEKVPSAMNRVAELLTEAGLPKGVFQIVHGAAEVVTSLCDHPKISGVTFVGSSKVAEIVSTRCHGLNKRVLALGGAKNHLIALPDCTVKMAANDIVASFAGCAGQRCMAASVLIVVDTDGGASGDELISTIVDVTSKLELGQGKGQVGPLIDTISKARVHKYIDEGTTKYTAKLLLDGRSKTPPASKTGGNWVGPTILLHTDHNDPSMTDEIFGPVLSIIRVSSWAEAIAIENGNPYGNAACIYTENGGSAQWFTGKFRAAMLGVNIGIPVPREPFSFGGLYGTKSKYGDFDVTGDGAMEFFTNRIKITQKWAPVTEAATVFSSAPTDVANFNGKM